MAMDLLQNSMILQLLWSNPFAIAVSVLLIVVATIWFLSNTKEKRKEEVGALIRVLHLHHLVLEVMAGHQPSGHRLVIDDVQYYDAFHCINHHGVGNVDIDQLISSTMVIIHVIL